MSHQSTDNTPTFASQLRRIRDKKGVSLYRLAQLTGLSKQGAYDLDKDSADPCLSTIVKVATALGVKPWELLPGWSSIVDHQEETAPEEEASPKVDQRRIQELRERKRKRVTAATTRELNKLKRKMAEDADRLHIDFAIKKGETDLEWAKRLATLDLERVHPATKPDLYSLFQEHGVPWPLPAPAPAEPYEVKLTGPRNPLSFIPRDTAEMLFLIKESIKEMKKSDMRRATSLVLNNLARMQKAVERLN
jgi:transcriptional regulator with XRE-family HTH domain